MKNLKTISIVGFLLLPLIVIIIPNFVNYAYLRGQSEILWHTELRPEHFLSYAGTVLAFLASTGLGLLALYFNLGLRKMQQENLEYGAQKDTYAYLVPRIVFFTSDNSTSPLELQEFTATKSEILSETGFELNMRMKASREMCIIGIRIAKLQLIMRNTAERDIYTSNKIYETNPFEKQAKPFHYDTSEVIVDHHINLPVKFIGSSKIDVMSADSTDVELNIFYINIFGVEVEAEHRFPLIRDKENPGKFTTIPDKVNTIIHSVEMNKAFMTKLKEKQLEYPKKSEEI